MTVSLVKKVARNIRYHTLPDWVGKQVVVNGIDSIEQDVKRGLELLLLDRGTLVEVERKFRQLALAKYDLLDLSFTLQSEWIWNVEIRGIPLLKQLYIVPPLAEDKLDRAFQLDMLDKLAEDIEQNKVYLLLFLRALELRTVKSRLLSLPDDYFPRTFVVEDACITNTDLAWFNKHFYL